MLKVKDIDAYLSLQSEEVVVALQKLRETIHAAAPDAEETISYGMPAFKCHGMLVGFAAFKKHCSFFPWNSHTVSDFAEELKKYTTSAGTIQFTLDKPLPATLVKKIVKARLKENIAKEAAKAKKK